MKILSITVLLAVYCCDAKVHILKAEPDNCCFKFYEKKIPKPEIRSIEKTHSRCLTAAFVINTSRGDFCVRQTEPWAMGEFVRRYSYGFERPIKRASASPQQKPNSVVHTKQLSTTSLPSRPERSHPESELRNFNGSAENPEHEDGLMFVCCVC